MIPKIKQGNSVPVKFTVMENGEQKDMTAATALSWNIRHAEYGCRRLPGITVVGGSNPYTIVVNTTAASPLGGYFISLSYLLGGESRSVDAAAFELTVHSAACGCQNPEKAICLLADTCIGAPGVSAYEIYKQHHPDTELTESEYGDAPVLAAGAATEAAGKANDAAEKATTAAGEANTAAEKATDAAGKANTAAEKAATSSEKANTAAEKATEATGKANSAAGKATDAAGKANEAADKADTAADKAGTASEKASTAATTAREQADRAEALGDHPPKIVDVDGLRYWSFWVESAGDYVTSDYRAEGGAILPVFWVDPATLMLHVTYQNGYEGAKFKLENGILYTVKTIENGRSN